MSSSVAGVSATQSISRKQLRAEITFARIREDGEHAFAGSQFLGGLACGVKNRTGRNATEDSFQFRESTCGGASVVVGDRDQLVHDSAIENLRNETRANALDFVRPGPATGEYRRVGRLNGIDFQTA